MSINNIFKCCKKNRFFLFTAGVTLGFSTSAGFMDKFLNKPILAAPVENPTNAPDIEPQITETVQTQVTEIVGPHKTYLSLFLTSTVIVVSGGLAYLTYGGGIIAISQTAYNMLNFLMTRMNRRPEIFRNIRGNRMQERILRDNMPNMKLMKDIKDVKKVVIANDEDMKKIIDKKVNESKQEYEDRIKKITDDNRDNVMKLNEEFAQRIKVISEKTKNLIDSMNQQMFFNIDKFQNNLIPRLENLEDRFFNPSKTKTVYYNDSEGLNETSMEDEESLVELDIAPERVENLLIENQQQDQVLFNQIANESIVYVQNRFYDIYTQNIAQLGEGRTFENNTVLVAADARALDDLYNRYNISREASIQQLLPANLELNPGQNNISETFYNKSYEDFKLFLNYGRMIIMGEIELRDNNGSIEEVNKMIKFANPEKLKITYENLPEMVYTLTFQKGNFAHRLYQQFKFYIIPIFNRLRYLGVSRFDPVLSKLLKIVAQNKFPKHIKIVNIPILSNITAQTLNTNIDFNKSHGRNYFSFQFENSAYFVLGSESIDEIADFSEKYDDMNINVNYQGRTLLSLERYEKKAKETLKILIDMMNKRDSYVDIIMIIEKIYETYFPKEHAKIDVN
jgi:hypothetical protein